MDRKTRRLRRIQIRSRRTKLVAGAVLAAAAVAVLAAGAFGQQGQGSPHLPKPQVDSVALTPGSLPIDAGWEGQVGTDADLVAVQWNGDQGAKYTFEVRNGNGDWRKAADTQVFDNGPDPGSQDALAGGATPDSKHVSEPVWVGKDVSGVRVRLDDGSAQDVTLHVIDSTSGKKPEKNVESTGVNTPAPAPPPTEPPLSAPASSSGASPPSSSTSTTTTTAEPAQQGLGLGHGLAAAAVATLAVAFIVRRRRALAVLIAIVVLVGSACAPTKDGGTGARPIPDAIVARSSWAPDLPWNWNACPGGPDYASHMSTAIVHHTVNSNGYGPGDSVGIMRGIWAYHVQLLGYCDIAYNFIIDNYGVPYEGRLGGIDQAVIGAHSLGYNTGTTGIAMLGTFSSVTPSNGALGTLENLIRWKLYIHGDNPFDDPAADILGHRDVYATECPGQALYDYLPYTRHFVKQYW